MALFLTIVTLFLIIALLLSHWLYISKCDFISFLQLWLCILVYILFETDFHTNEQAFSWRMDVGPAHHWPQENIFWISSKMIHQIWWTIALKNLTSCLVFENKLNKNASVAADKSKTHFPSTATWLRFCLCVCVFTKTIVSRPRRKLALFGLHLEHETGLVSQRELKRETGWSRFWFWFHLRECLFYPCTRANLSSGWTGAKRTCRDRLWSSVHFPIICKPTTSGRPW